MVAKSIQERAALVAARLAEVKAHPMCASFSEDRHWYFVVYPEGEFPVHGVRVSKGGGKWVALGRLLIVMERHWKESFPGARQA